MNDIVNKCYSQSSAADHDTLTTLNKINGYPVSESS